MLRAGQRLGKYRIRRRLAQGGFAAVYEAHDSIEGIVVALKVPLGKHVRPEILADFKREARLAANLEHPNILPLKNADYIDGVFCIVYPLGLESLADRLSRRMSLRSLLDIAEQLLAALAHAHEHRVIHCDIKPENLILFDDERVRLADFGIAKVAMQTINASASGTLGYMAPEQAMGRPSAKSDVFSAALVIYRMITGELPEWPYDWPLPGHERLHKRAPELEPILQKALTVDARRRYRDAGALLEAFRPATKKIVRRLASSRDRGTTSNGRHRDWRTIRHHQFRRQYGKALTLDHACGSCGNPVDERMHTCPWCGAEPLPAEGTSSFPGQCPRCSRGVKLDWRYCPWCYGAKIGPAATRTFTDRRYAARCENPRCTRKELMPFMRYCPWCHTKVKKRWKMGSKSVPCHRCHQPVAPGFWSWCAWCGTPVEGS